MASASKGAGGAMGKDEFLRLLVTQLSHQDPLNPMDGQQFAAQLAQFSSVEQLIGVNESLSGLSELQGALAQNMNNGIAAGLIGRDVRALGNGTTLSADGNVDLHFRLDGTADEVTVVVRNASGEPVRTLSAKTYGAGDHSLAWDGRDDAGNRLPPGSYSFDVQATRGEGAVAATPFTQGRVDRVSFGPDGVLLWVRDTPIPLSAVESVVQSGE